jgi:hypothetical protein
MPGDKIDVHPQSTLWLAVSHENRVKYTLDRCRARRWLRSGKYKEVRSYIQARMP